MLALVTATCLLASHPPETFAMYATTKDNSRDVWLEVVSKAYLYLPLGISNIKIYKSSLVTVEKPAGILAAWRRRTDCPRVDLVSDFCD